MNVELDPDLDAAIALADVFDALLVAMEENEDGVRRQLDLASLHDFRVAVRRTRSIARLARPLLPDAMTRLWKADWKWLAGVTSEARDLDVFLEELSVDGDGLRELADRARARRASTQARLRTALDGDRYRALQRGWRAGIAELRTVGMAGTGTDAATLARRTIAAASKRFVHSARAIDEDAPAGEIHKVRKRAKRLRYAAELLGSALPKREVKELVAATKRLQDELGRFQDAEVQRQLVRAVLDDPTQPSPSAGAVAAGDALVEQLTAAQAAARHDLVKSLRKMARTGS